MTVKVYLMRHGEALPKELDPARPLSESGAARARRVARFIAGAGVAVAEVWHSTKLRARQTAEIVAAEAGLAAPSREVLDLEPEAEVEPLADALAAASGDLMLVGHLPQLNRLASLLVAGSTDLQAFVFEDCGVLCLERRAEPPGPTWTVRWMLAPSTLVEGTSD